jgi:hypothetical protein
VNQYLTLMNRYILIASVLAIAGLIEWRFADDLVMAAVPTHNAAPPIAGPEVEIATDNFAIIRWAIPTPGGTDLHFGIVHYGTDAAKLTQVAKSPNRRNSSHPDMIFRVRITGLNSNTSYYYTVESTGATGASDGVSSAVRAFKTK